MGTTTRDSCVRTVRPSDLVPGDVVLLDGVACEVISAPFTGVAGKSLFDSSEVFWRVRLRVVAAPAKAGYATWKAHDLVTLLQPQSACELPIRRSV
jgi:hypothetical protein